ncbi:MAG: ArnT family glycosyltransferase [Isosphaeraceae bacterium]
MRSQLDSLAQSRIARWITEPSRLWRVPVVIFFLLLLTGFLGAAQTGLFDRDEPRNAQAAREMLRSGDWLVPSFNGEPRLQKPILIYWLMAASYRIFGDNATAARLPSIVSAAGAGVLVYLFAAKWFGRRVAGWSIIIWATLPLTLAESRMATTDSLLNFQVMANMLCLAGLYQGPSAALARLFWLMFGLSVLTKGPVAVLPIAGAVIFTRYATGVKLPWAWLRPGEGILLCSALVLPWLVAVSVATDGEFLRFAAGREMLGRTIRPAEGHWGLPGYYLAMLPVMFFPWFAFLPRAISDAWRQRKTDPRLAFLLGWAVLPLVPLELMATKLVHYHYPSYAALAVLVGREIYCLEQVGTRPYLLAGGRFIRGSVIGMSALAAALFLGFAWTGTWLVSAGSLVVAAVFIGGLVVMIPQVQQGAWRKLMPTLAVTWAAVVLITIAWVLPASQRGAASHRVAARLQELSRQLQVTAILGEYREPSVIFDLRSDRPVVISRKLADIRRIVRETGAVVMPVLADDLAIMQKANDLEVQVVGEVRAFDFQQGRRREIGLAVVSLKPEERVAMIRELSGRDTTKLR